MLEAKEMALMIFTMLNVTAVGFLLYVLVHFWKEGHKSGVTMRAGRIMSGYGDRPTVVVVTAPITCEACREDDGVIQFPVRSGSGQQHGDANNVLGRTREMPQSAAR